MAFTEIYRDDFDNNIIDVFNYNPTPGSSMAEPAGSHLVLSNTAGIRLSNFSFFYEHLACNEQDQTITDIPVDQDDFYRFTGKLSSIQNITNSDGSSRLVTSFILGNGDLGGIINHSRKYQFGLYSDSSNWVVFLTRHLATYTVTDKTEIIAISDTDNINMLFRCYFNNSGVVKSIPEDGSLLETNQVAFYYSLNNGVNWINFIVNPGGTGDLPLSPGVEISTGNSGNHPGFDAVWDYINIERSVSDNNSPVVTNQDPAPLETDTGVNQIAFSIEDDETVELESVKIVVDGVTVYSNGVFIPGWTNSTVASNAQNGYDFVLLPHSLFLGATVVNVGLVAEDSGFNILDTSWSFTTASQPSQPPEIINQNPANGSVNVLLSAGISFSLKDESGIDLTTLQITVDGVTVYENMTFSSGWTDSSVVADIEINGYHVSLVSDNLLKDTYSYEVQVKVSDIAGDNIDQSWYFETIVQTVPFTTNQLTVSNIEVIASTIPGSPYSLRPINRLNQFDEHGSLVGVSRLRGEKNKDYKRRIQDAMVNRANSSYRGMVNGVTRELGLSLFEGITINPKRDSGGQFMASDPYIAFDGVYLLLYSDLSLNALDWAIDRYQTGGNFEHLGRLVDVVNDTEFFEASLVPDVDPFIRSMSVFNQSNRNEVRIEFIPESTKFRLKHRYLVRGSVFFSNRSTFRTEVDTVSDVTSTGKYHIDYTTGIVTVYTTPGRQQYARYRYTQYPFRALASPVILHDINKDSFRVKMFEQILQDNGEFAHGLPTELGVDIINELMSVSPMYWGI